MLIGYARVSKSDGSQSLGSQIDALVQAGIQFDTTISMGKLVVEDFVALAEFERELIIAVNSIEGTYCYKFEQAYHLR